MGAVKKGVKKVGSAVKKVAKKVKFEDVLKFGLGGPGALIAKGINKATGLKTDALFNPVGTLAGNLGEKFVDKPKALKEESKRFAAEQAEKQAAQLRELDQRKVQEGAEKDAAETLNRKRKKQSRRRSRSISTGTIGGSSQEGQNSLIGL